MTKKVDLQDVKKAVDFAREMMPLFEPYIKKHGPEVVERVAERARKAADSADEARKNAFEKIKQRKDFKERQKICEEAKKRAVASSLPPIDAKEFFKNFEDNVVDHGDLRSGYMAIPGCYAIITMKSSREKDSAAYKDVFVGCSETIGFAVYSQLRGFGNVDVYADFKFNAPMKILIYPCELSKMQEKCISLVDDLQSISSYNKWEAMAAASCVETK